MPLFPLLPGVGFQMDVPFYSHGIQFLCPAAISNRTKASSVVVDLHLRVLLQSMPMQIPYRVYGV